jgi:hypothetical protein
MTYKKQQGGYIILFTVLIVTLILAMSLGIANVTVREQNLTRSSRESHYALFAADTGGECVLYHYNKPTSYNNDEPNPFHLLVSGSRMPVTLKCAGQEITSVSIPPLPGSGDLYIFPPLELARGCVIISARIDEERPGGAASDRRDTLIAKGYNVSCDQATSNPVSPRRVERVLEYTYDYIGN